MLTPFVPFEDSVKLPITHYSLARGRGYHSLDHFPVPRGSYISRICAFEAYQPGTAVHKFRDSDRLRQSGIMLPHSYLSN